MILRYITVALLFQLVVSQRSPCPEIFSYEPKGTEDDRWYGVISLKTKEDLSGVWLRIVLDRPAELLGNWFGEAVSSDNKEFTIKNPSYRLEAGPPVSVRFFVKYNTASTIPQLSAIRLNGKTICSVEGETITTSRPQLHISQIRPTESSRPSSGTGSSRPSSSGSSSSSNGRPSSNNKPSSSNGRPSNSRPSVGGTTHRPSNNFGSGSSSSNNFNSERPNNNFGSSGSGSSSSSNNFNSERPSNNFGSGSSSSNSFSNERPSNNFGSGSSSSSSNNFNSNERENESGINTGTSTSNGFTQIGGHDLDYFPGDFAINRPPINPLQSGSGRPSKREVQCGTIAMKPSPLITGGQSTTQGQWPWHVALYHSQRTQLMYTCGGTLISQEFVLTAAHCVTKPHSNRPINLKNLMLYLGKYNLQKFGPEIQDREAAEIFVHPQYNHSYYFNDIALVRLETPAEITNYVRPCCLWEDSPDLDNVIHKAGTVIGWGFDNNHQISNNLMQAQMPVVSTSTCIFSNREFFSQFTSEKTYCAGFRNGTSVCNGDSGGGMVFPKHGSSSQNPVWQIRGLVSVGVALQGQGICDPSNYVVFTDVAKYVDWIRRIINQ